MECSVNIQYPLVEMPKDFVHSLGIQKRRLQKHKGAVNTISFNSSGSLLLSASDDDFSLNSNNGARGAT